MLAFRSFLVSQRLLQLNYLPLIDVDLATFVMIIYYAIRSKSQYGMPHLIKRVLEDTTIYFFVMALCHLVLALFAIFAKVVASIFSRIYV